MYDVVVYCGETEVRELRTAIYLDEETKSKIDSLRMRLNLSGIMRVVVSALVMNDAEFARWLKADKVRKETYLWIREKVGGQRKLDL